MKYIFSGFFEGFFSRDQQCSFEERSLKYFLAEEPEYLKTFSLLVVSRLENDLLTRLRNLLFDENIPIIQTESIGMFGRTRIILKEHAVLEAHPEHALPDLRRILNQNYDKIYMSSLRKTMVSHPNILIMKSLVRPRMTHNESSFSEA